MKHHAAVSTTRAPALQPTRELVLHQHDGARKEGEPQSMMNTGGGSRDPKHQKLLMLCRRDVIGDVMLSTALD